MTADAPRRGRTSPRRARAALLTVLVMVAMAPAISTPIDAAPDQAAPGQAPAVDPFYDPPSPLPDGAPGDLIKAEPMAVRPLPGVPLPLVDAWRIMYLSTDANDEPIAITGTLMMPKTPWLVGRRPLVSYAVGGHGMGEQCTPSIQFNEGTQFETSVIGAYLLQGWAVVLTDYQRRPEHTFVNSKMAGHAVLDAARAAPQISGARLTTQNPVGISGFSQGGNAAAAAAERQPGYAPELNLKGVAAGGVPADLQRIANAVDGGFLAGVIPMAVASLQTAYPELTLDGLNDQGREAVEWVKGQCIPATTTRYAFSSTTSWTEGGKTLDEFLAAHPDWKARVDEQRIGRLAPTAPVLTYVGLLDPWTPHDVTRQLAADWCAQGSNVRFTTYPIAEHFGGLGEAIPQVLTWLHARFRNQPATHNC